MERKYFKSRLNNGLCDKVRFLLNFFTKFNKLLEEHVIDRVKAVGPPKTPLMAKKVWEWEAIGYCDSAGYKIPFCCGSIYINSADDLQTR